MAKPTKQEKRHPPTRGARSGASENTPARGIAKRAEPDVAADESRLSSAMTVLNALEFVGSAPTRRLVDIVRFLQRPKSTVLRLLDTLVRAGFARRLGPGEYGVTLKVWRLGCQALEREDFHSLIMASLKRMAMDTGESGLFAIYEFGHAVYVDKADSPQPVAASVSIGSRSPAYASATGKVLLAYQPSAEIERVISQARACTPRTITDRRALRAELATVRERRLAFSVGEWREDIAGAAAPVFGRAGEVVGTVGISCPRARVEERLEVLGAIVQSAAKELSDIWRLPPSPPELTRRAG